jgi:D-alanyl-D-alanine carboxypeptidase
MCRRPISASWVGRSRLTVAAIAAGFALLLSVFSPQPAAACAPGHIKTSAGCKSREAADRAIKKIVKQFAVANDLRAAIVRVTTKDRILTTTSPGRAAPGVPATGRMHFRIGSIAIPYLTALLLQLVDEGKLKLDDPISKWLPTVPNANQVTLRMLASNTSGYPDFFKNNPPVIAAIYANPYRQWTANELLQGAFAQPIICPPGTCFYYAHTNFLLLSRVLQTATGKRTAKLLKRRVLEPLGLRETVSSEKAAIPKPFLHAWDAERGFYENSTRWSPSPTINGGVTMTGTIGDVAKTARAIGTGRLLSKRSRREMFSPVPVPNPFPAFNQELYYGLGMILSYGWQLQNPQLFGYRGVMGYLPPRKLSIALTLTEGPTAAVQPVAFHQLLFAELADYLAPGHHPVFP